MEFLTNRISPGVYGNALANACPSASCSKFAKMGVFAFWGLIALQLFILPLFLIPRLITDNPVVHSKEFIGQIFACVLLGASVVAVPKRLRIPCDLFDVSLLFLLCSTIISMCFAGAQSFNDSWLYLGYIVIAFVMARMPLTSFIVNTVIGSVITSATLCSLYGLSMYFGYNPLESFFPFITDTQSRSKIISFLGNPEYLGTYLAPVACLSFAYAAFAICRLRWGQVLLHGSVTLILLATIVLTGARGALFGLLFGFSVVGLSLYSQLNARVRSCFKGMLIAGVLLAVGLVAVFSYPNPLNTRGVRLADRFVELTDLKSASVKERVFFYTVAGAIIEQSPVWGVGPGNYKNVFYPYVEKVAQKDETVATYNMLLHIKTRVAEHAHNDYLEMWVDTGTVGFTAFLMLIALLCLSYFRRMSVNRPEEAHPLLRLNLTQIFGCTICILVIALFSFPFHMPVRASLAWTMIGLLIGLYRIYDFNTAQIAVQEDTDGSKL